MNFFVKLFSLLIYSNMNLATWHWLSQRITSIVLIPLTFLFLFPFVRHIYLDHSQLVEIYENPLRSIVAFLFLAVTVVHFKQGAEIIIEDYIHHKKIIKAMLLANRLLLWTLIFSLVYAFVKITLVNQWSN